MAPMTKHPRACRLKKELQAQNNPKEDDPESDPESGPEEEQNTEDEFEEPKSESESEDDEEESDDDSEEEEDTDDDSCSESDSDHSETNHKHKSKKQKTLKVDEQLILDQALKKCRQVSDALRAYADPKTAITNRKKYVQRTDVNGACGIPHDDISRNVKPYQMTGINFLWVLRKVGVEGAILADEMGLGKTIQVIVFLAVLKHMQKTDGPHLVVAPVSVLQNWKEELARWCPSFNAVVYHGSRKIEFLERKRSYGSGEGEFVPFEILITSYSIFEGNSLQMKKDRKFLRKFAWDCVVMDEGHCLKDATSYRNKRLQSIVYNANQRIMLTGTPIQNDLQELWWLLSFLMPTIFEANKDGVQDCFGARKDKPQDDVLIKMRNFLKPFVLRRVKSDVLNQLPPKRYFVVPCDMAQAPSQDQLYKSTLTYWQSYARSKTTNEDLSNALTRQEMSNIFCGLRKISNHPLLVRKIYTNEDVDKLARKFHKLGVFGKRCSLESVCKTLASNTDYDLHKLCEEYGGIENGPKQLPNQYALSSTKCQELSRLLFQLHKEGHRCLLFSQWTKILDILEWALNVLGYTFIRLDGKTKVEDRQDLVNKFNNNKNIFIFLISSRAGGQGLNLVGADTVIIHDVDFNPQVDRQAEDRCHRIGQTRPVTVYKLVTGDSVDENIFNIAEKKLTLDAALLQTPEKSYEGEIVRKIINNVKPNINQLPCSLITCKDDTGCNFR